MKGCTECFRAAGADAVAEMVLGRRELMREKKREKMKLERAREMWVERARQRRRFKGEHSEEGVERKDSVVGVEDKVDVLERLRSEIEKRREMRLGRIQVFALEARDDTNDDEARLLRSKGLTVSMASLDAVVEMDESAEGQKEEEADMKKRYERCALVCFYESLWSPGIDIGLE